MSGGHAYLTVVDWPAGFGRGEMIESLVAAAGLDVFQAEQRVAKPAPMIIARMPPIAAESAAEVLHRLGVTVHVLNDTELDGAPKPIRLKRLEPAIGAPKPMYLCEPWREESFGLVCASIFLIVRARLIRQSAGEPQVESRVGYDPMVGLHVSSNVVKTTESQVSHIMDLWLADGRRLRIDAGKFNFDVLGEDRGQSDLPNTDRLALLLARQAPNALIDTAFERFSAPPGVLRTSGRRVGLDGRSFRQDSPVFEFYSVWAAAVYRRMTGR